MTAHNIPSSKRSFVALTLLVFLVLLTGCSNSVAIPTETLVPTASPTARITSTPASTFTPTITPSPTTPPTPTIDPSWVSLDNDWLQMYYPKDWNVEESDCASGSEACIIQLTHVDSETLTIQLTILPPMGASSDVEQADEDDWNMREISAMSVGAGDLLKLISVDEIEVDGVKAMKRLYEYPLVDMITGQVKDTQYNYRVLFVDDEYTYTFEMQTTSSEEFASYTDVADQIVGTISFSR